MIIFILKGALCLFVAQVAKGEPGKPITTYNINTSVVTTTTKVEKQVSQAHRDLMGGYVLETALNRVLVNTQYVRGIMISPEGEEEPTTATYLDYTTYKRKSKVFVSLSLPAPVTLLLSASESYRVCKLTVEKPRNPEGGGPSKNGGGSSSSAKSCMLETTVTLSGPLKVYGNHTARVNVDQLLNEKQEFTFTVKTDSAVADTTIESRFNIKSVLFEDSILEFAKIFNVPIVSAGENVEPLSGGSSKFFSRQTMMVGIARLLRSINESVLNMGIEGEGVSQ